ncbi:glycerol kinase [Spizellomyces punctatus DAOM BR117]|uniref:Probable glycerol kinase n=1 Tax=Spizellomyces punctatus (strain DAOM BR117) TaxID=645134 RepID=A0A0L0HEY1_SPIPD|nr:glycerol kinase [Spizellomyces punctatus DAOM BR117]KNC99544.1 glycerol kinase [Spizellomyces punctatus DAOM BR117]|eukprot:XP_016607584.1 glycerol kinase [Spizellomyces punctatus DAOM BR117]
MFHGSLWRKSLPSHPFPRRHSYLIFHIPLRILMTSAKPTSPTGSPPRSPTFSRFFSFLKGASSSSIANGTSSRKSMDKKNGSTKSVQVEKKPPQTFVGAIDQGTSSSRFMVFNEKGAIVTMHQMEFEQIYPKAGWCEHDPDVIMGSVNECIAKVADKLEAMGHSVTDIKAVGITNQRETTVVWDKTTGKPLHHAVVWLDGRTKDTVAQLVEKSSSKTTSHWHDRCGLPFSTYFSGVKLRWLLDNVEEVRKAHQEGRLAFGTVDSWLIYNLTGGINGGKHVSDVTNASRTMFMNIQTLQWDDEILEFFDVKKEVLPEIVSSAEVYGNIVGGPLAGIPIAGCLGDQQAAVVGQRCFNPGEVKNTYGTGCFMLFNTGEKPVISTHGLLTTVGYKLGKDAPAVYALEGSVAIAGAAIKWLRDNLKMIKEAPEINELAAKVEDTGGVYFVPAFSGLFAPHWRDDARGCIVGLTQFATREHIARATLEAICFQSKEVLDAMNADAGHDLALLKVDGGMTNSELGMQIQADLLGIEVVRPAMRETTALGAALAAGLTVGIWKDLKDFSAHETPDVFKPTIEAEERSTRYANWKKAVERSLGWV